MIRVHDIIIIEECDPLGVRMRQLPRHVAVHRGAETLSVDAYDDLGCLMCLCLRRRYGIRKHLLTIWDCRDAHCDGILSDHTSHSFASRLGTPYTAPSVT